MCLRSVKQEASDLSGTENSVGSANVANKHSIELHYKKIGVGKLVIV